MEQTQKGYALITGASSGIGYEMATLFAADGYPLIIVGRDGQVMAEKARELRAAHSVEVVPVKKDLFNPNAAQKIYDEVKSKGLTVEVLVNDAGQGQYGLFAEADLQRLLEIIQLKRNIVHGTYAVVFKRHAGTQQRKDIAACFDRI
jgi:short-subunit dehydrogenase